MTIVNGYEIKPYAELTGADLSGAALRWANLMGAELEGAELEGADLTGAGLTGADLRRADLRRADLTGARLYRVNLYGAKLSWADLSGAELKGANLTGADLTGADLSWAKLQGADLTRADMKGAMFGSAPIINDIHKELYKAVRFVGNLDMSSWHCGTSHCWGGWIVHLAGEEGCELESRVGTVGAALAIYSASDPSFFDNELCPDFYSSNKKAMKEIKRLAGMK